MVVALVTAQASKSLARSAGRVRSALLLDCRCSVRDDSCLLVVVRSVAARPSALLFWSDVLVDCEELWCVVEDELRSAFDRVELQRLASAAQFASTRRPVHVLLGVVVVVALDFEVDWCSSCLVVCCAGGFCAPRTNAASGIRNNNDLICFTFRDSFH
jgi:hypothetical protein